MLFIKCMGNLTISMAISIANCNSHYQRVNQVLQLLSRFLPIAILVGECEPRISAVASFSSTKPSICLVRWLLWKASVAGARGNHPYSEHYGHFHLDQWYIIIKYQSLIIKLIYLRLLIYESSGYSADVSIVILWSPSHIHTDWVN